MERFDLDERCDEASLEINDSFTCLRDSLKIWKLSFKEKQNIFFNTHENQVLDQIRQSSIG